MLSVRSRTVLHCVVGVLFALQPVCSQSQVRNTSEANELLLDQIVVSASRHAQAVVEAPAAVTVITEKEIRNSGASNLLDILRYVPGLDIVEQGASTTDVSIRGFNSEFPNKLLIMVDGRSIYEDLRGGISWVTQPLQLIRIKRIEVVRGPGSALYGANAFNGVINIITKTPEELAASTKRVQFQSILGSNNTQLTELQSAFDLSHGWTVALGASYNHTDGYGHRNPDMMRDSYTVPTVNLDVAHRIKRSVVTASVGNSESIDDLMATGNFWPDTHYHTSYAMLNYAEDQGKAPVTARVYSNFVYGTNGGLAVQKSNSVDVDIQQVRMISSRQNLVYGMSYRQAGASCLVTSPGWHRDEMYALFAEDDYRIGRTTHLFLGARYDNHSLHGSDFSPRVSMVHSMPGRQSIRLSYGEAFRNPTLLDSYLDGTLNLAPGADMKMQGNIDLKPEKVKSIELGYRREVPGGYWAVSAFYNQVTNFIDSVPIAFFPPPFPSGTPSVISFVNASGTNTVLGMELETSARLTSKTHVYANYAVQNLKYADGKSSGMAPKHKINFRIESQLGRRLDGFIGGHFVGRYAENSTIGVMPVADYFRLDARLGYKIGPKDNPWMLSLVGHNLLGDNHIEFPLTTLPGEPLITSRQRTTIYAMLSGKL